MLGDLGIDQFLAMLLQLAKRAFLVGAHQPAVASNVHSQNRGKPPIDASLDHAVFLSGYYVTHQYLPSPASHLGPTTLEARKLCVGQSMSA
jgi:hypothetical protein